MLADHVVVWCCSPVTVGNPTPPPTLTPNADPEPDPDSNTGARAPGEALTNLILAIIVVFIFESGVFELLFVTVQVQMQKDVAPDCSKTYL